MKTFSYLALTAILFVAFQSDTVAQKKRRPTFNHFALYIVDLNKSTAFYRDIIGLQVIPEPFKDGRHTWFKIAKHGQLHIIQGAKEITEHVRDTHLCFSVASVDDFVTRLNNANIKFTNATGVPQTVTTRTDGIKQIYFQDPDNYWVEINDDKY
jgi:lactoylglutathione lyase